ncbi:hypothetical protein Misp01_27860 [Microtetraspora sp. NBRC 13810]|uniref:hypothetical protein n=1 Tax=Microtetraspora sp. NBRC 13810 TaxID=3030990 RepID=UPI0024A2AFFA|nr:hypothetical protein [Microtetraspora sp. NBRC 13810]GLW07656.1 hypothetical protein Misp01_27860 [Microtetraspora sp. NBRC 13810]
MTRSEFDDIRAYITAETTSASDLLEVARTLLDDLEEVRMREATLRAYYLRLLTAARATVAARGTGDPEPLTFLEAELAKRGQLPEAGEQAHRILSDARTAAEFVARLEKQPMRILTPRNRPRCYGAGRTLPR